MALRFDFVHGNLGCSEFGCHCNLVILYIVKVIDFRATFESLRLQLTNIFEDLLVLVDHGLESIIGGCRR